MFILHLLLQSLLALISRYRHHEAALFASHNLPTELKHAVTLLLTWIVFRHWVIPARSGSPSGVLRMLGDISYPLYLLHFWVFALLSTRGVHDSFLLVITSLALSFVVYFVIDRYSRRRHLEPSRA
jgi:peptidoglycan/LPS O-acetylase OafA/YrhL